MKIDTVKLRTAIRNAIRDTGVDISMEDIRKVRDKVNERIKSGEECCHICTSAARVLDMYKSKDVAKLMDKIVGSGGVMEHVVKVYYTDFQGEVTAKQADKLRQEFMRVWADIKRNRKGNKAPKELKVGVKIRVLNEEKGSGSCNGKFFKVGDTGVVTEKDTDLVWVLFDRHTCASAVSNEWCVAIRCLEVI